MKHRFPPNRKEVSNRLLAALPADEYERISTHLDLFSLPFGMTIYSVRGPIDHVYFPNSGMISLLAAIEESSTLEVGIVGREGLAGLPLFFGMKRSSIRAIVQGSGSAMRMSAVDFTNEIALGGSLSRLLLRFSHSIMMQISQSAVCFRFHGIEMRMARWLLMTSDRTESNEFQMTQGFLSNMIGVRREAVNKAARLLEGKGLIAHSRNNMLIIDRPGLEATACICYSIIRDEEVVTIAA